MYFFLYRPPFLLRAFTMGVLWPSLGRLLINAQNDTCTMDLINSELEHIAAAAITSQLMDVSAIHISLCIHQSIYLSVCLSSPTSG